MAEKRILELSRIPDRVTKDYEIHDWTDEGLDLSAPEGYLVFDLGDGRALVGLLEWSPSIKVDEATKVTMKMFMGKKKEN